MDHRWRPVSRARARRTPREVLAKHTISGSLSPASWPRCVHARARPIHGPGELEVQITGERVVLARARAPRAPAPRVEAVGGARSRVFRDLRVLASGVGRRWYTKSSPLVLAGHTFYAYTLKSVRSLDFCKRAPCAIIEPFENARAKQHSSWGRASYHHIPVGSLACVLPHIRVFRWRPCSPRTGHVQAAPPAKSGSIQQLVSPLPAEVDPGPTLHPGSEHVAGVASRLERGYRPDRPRWSRGRASRQDVKGRFRPSIFSSSYPIAPSYLS